MRTGWICELLLVVVVGIAGPACADYGKGASEDAGSDAGKDGQTTEEGPFCQGAARVEFEGRSYTQVAVTSERLVMDCCDGAMLRFHLTREIGFDVMVAFQFFGTSMVPGEYELSPEAGLGSAQALIPGTPPEQQPMEGSLQIQGGASFDHFLTFTLCAEVEAGGTLAGLRLWVENFPLMPYSWWEVFGIHKLDDPTISADQAARMPLDSLVLDPEPLVDLGTLAYYEAGTHTLFFGGWRTANYVRNQLPEVGVYGLPFVVVAHGEKIYLGAFYTLLSSVGFEHPVIIMDFPDNANDRLVIERNYAAEPPPGTPDPRSDSRLLDLLRAAGKLKP
jgi:hypothetical protein